VEKIKEKKKKKIFPKIFIDFYLNLNAEIFVGFKKSRPLKKRVMVSNRVQNPGYAGVGRFGADWSGADCRGAERTAPTQKSSLVLKRAAK